MGTPGVPWVKDNAIILTAIKKHKGRITHIAKDPSIDCAIITIRTRINNTPELKEMLEDCRNNWVEDTLNQAEDVLKQAMDKIDSDANVALKSAMFFLNNQGKDRGYSSPEEKASQSHYTIKLDSNGLGAGVNISTPSLPNTNNQIPESGH